MRFPRLRDLPAILPLEGSVRIELEEGIPVFRASDVIQDRIEHLVRKQASEELTHAENEELDIYEELDDHLSTINRLMRNRALTHNEEHNPCNPPTAP